MTVQNNCFPGSALAEVQGRGSVPITDLLVSLSWAALFPHEAALQAAAPFQLMFKGVQHVDRRFISRRITCRWETGYSQSTPAGPPCMSQCADTLCHLLLLCATCCIYLHTPQHGMRPPIS